MITVRTGRFLSFYRKIPPRLSSTQLQMTEGMKLSTKAQWKYYIHRSSRFFFYFWFKLKIIVKKRKIQHGGYCTQVVQIVCIHLVMALGRIAIPLRFECSLDHVKGSWPAKRTTHGGLSLMGGFLDCHDGFPDVCVPKKQFRESI